jgi:hypothetical protein
VTLRALSADAVAPIAEALPSLDAHDRAVAESILACVDPEQLSDHGWAGINLARTHAADLLRTLALPACPEPD